MDSSSEPSAMGAPGQTLGWCEHTLVNETVDDHGRLVQTPKAERDPRAPAHRRYDDPQVCELREHLQNHNGIHGLEICAPHELERIATIFHRDGFVVVKDLLDAEQVEDWHTQCERVMHDILKFPGQGLRKYTTESNRLPHRYSFGTASASRELLHEACWAGKVDLPTTTPILARLFGTMDYCVLGSGGDFCLPGAVEYQVLHTDYPPEHSLPAGRLRQAESQGVRLDRDETGQLTPRTQQLALIHAPPIITINFMTSELTPLNGPIRHIPGSHAFPHRAPDQYAEPEWMRLSTLTGVPAGAGVFRDSRAWHGATPNLTRSVRMMPNVEYAAAWLDDSWFKQTLPADLCAGLSEHAQHICRRVVAPVGFWPAGAGEMHPVTHERQKLNRAMHR